MPRRKSDSPGRLTRSQRERVEASSVNKSFRKKKTKRMRIGNKVYQVNLALLKDIKKLQMSTTFCIPKLPFSRIVKETMQEVAVNRDLRVQIEALQALQESAEMYLVEMFEDSNLAACHARRITIRPIDMKLVLRLRR